MSLITRVVSKQGCSLKKGLLLGLPSSLIASKSTGSAQKQMDDFWNKNQSVKRPMSPHLTIYKFQLTSMLSITHRATGILLAGATIGAASATLLPPSVFSVFFSLVSQVHASGMGYLCLFPLKFMLAWPVMFHTCNGLRHLVWDFAQGLKIEDVYKSGWAVLIVSSLLAAALSMAFTTK